MEGAKLSTWDFVAIGLYFTAVIAAGLYSMCRSNRGTVSGYFLAGRFMIWLPVGASLFASNIGSEHFIGLAGSGAASGISVGAFELNACILLQLLGWVFLPVYIASGVHTLPEYMKKRFGGTRIRVYLASLSLALYIFTKISVNLYSGALFIKLSLNWNLYLSVFLLLFVTAITTVTGGLAAVIYTDTLQCFVMVAGAFVLMILSFIRVGGYEALYYGYMNAIPNTTLYGNTTCGLPREDSWTMLRDPVDSDMPWPAFLFGQTPASIWYWCTDQMMVQRTLAAKSLSHAQGGTLFAGWLKLLPLFLIVLPGMISRVLFPDEVGCADPGVCMQVCENPVGCSNIAYPKLVLDVMPTGLKGVMMSVMLAALMSDLTSVFNSASTLFTMDIYQNMRPKSSVRELMIVGRGFVVAMIVVSILWIPIIQNMQGAQLFIYIQAISAYLAPPIAAIYLLAVLWPRGNEKGAFAGLMSGLVIGVTRMTLDFVYTEPRCGEEDLRPAFIARWHYMYFAMFLFWFTGIVMIVVSLCSASPTRSQLIRNTFWTRHSLLTREDEFYMTGLEAKTINADDAPLNTEETKGNDHSTDPISESVAKEEILLKPEKDEYTESPSLCRRGYDWFCGFDNSKEGLLKQKELDERILKITSLKQDPRARVALLVLLVILGTLDLVLYIVFSTGSDLGQL